MICLWYWENCTLQQWNHCFWWENICQLKSKQRFINYVGCNSVNLLNKLSFSLIKWYEFDSIMMWRAMLIWNHCFIFNLIIIKIIWLENGVYNNNILHLTFRLFYFILFYFIFNYNFSFRSLLLKWYHEK